MRVVREVAWWIGWALFMAIILGGMSFLRHAMAEGSRGIIERPLPPTSREDVWGRPGYATEDPQNYLPEPRPITCRFFPWQIDAAKLVLKEWWIDPKSGTQWWVQEYDHTGDDQVDTIVLTLPLARYPSRYGFDIDGDIQLDWLYQDNARNGQCQSISIIKQPAVKNQL